MALTDMEIIEKLTNDLNEVVREVSKYEGEGWLAPLASPQFLLAAANIQSAIANLEIARMHQMRERRS